MALKVRSACAAVLRFGNSGNTVKRVSCRVAGVVFFYRGK